MKKAFVIILIISLSLATSGLLMDGDSTDPSTRLRIIEFFAMTGTIFVLASTIYYISNLIYRRIKSSGSKQ